MSDQARQVRTLVEMIRKRTLDETTRWSRMRTFLLTNWTLLSFLAAIAVGIYVKYSFGIDYFESYRNAAATKSMADYYREMGDRMLGKQEWSAAEQAYRESIKLNSNNVAAQYGLIKATVFQPPGSSSFVDPQLAENRLTFLRIRFPDDPEIDYLQAINELRRNDLDAAIEALKVAIKKKSDFAPAYDNLGYVYTKLREPKKALDAYAHAVRIDPRSATARSNLGWEYLDACNFHRAVDELSVSEKIWPLWVTEMGLGEGMLFDARPDEARELLQRVATEMEEADPAKNASLFGSEWTFSYRSTDQCRGEYPDAVTVYRVDSKRAVAHLLCALANAAEQRLDVASRELAMALRRDSSTVMVQFYMNHLAGLSGSFVVTPSTQRWIDKTTRSLAKRSD